MRVVRRPYWSMTVMRSVLSRYWRGGACANAGVTAATAASATVDRTATVIRRMIPHKDLRRIEHLTGGPRASQGTIGTRLQFLITLWRPGHALCPLPDRRPTAFGRAHPATTPPHEMTFRG